ncbi:hypothetical protein [Amycolatopsis ultiminotia]
MITPSACRPPGHGDHGYDGDDGANLLDAMSPAGPLVSPGRR